MNVDVKKVEVTNFPRKTIWEKLMYLTTVLALLVAIISLYLYLNEINKIPDIHFSVFSPTKRIGKTYFEFDNKSNYSKYITFNVSLINKGNLQSNSAEVILTFSPIVKSNLVTTNHWYIDSIGEDNDKKFEYYLYRNNNIKLNPNSYEHIGNFKVSIPKISDELLVLMFFLKGDFKQKNGLVYYNFKKNEYKIIQDKTSRRTFDNLWNQHLDNLEEQELID